MSTETTTFKNLKLRRWRQLEDVQIDFHPKLTVLTGANASGKTTILNVLGRHFGWGLSFVTGRTRTIKKEQGPDLYSDSWNDDSSDEQDNNRETVGQLAYNNEHISPIFFSPTPSAQYQVQVYKQQKVNGIHIPSHRTVVTYQKIDNIPAVPQTSAQVYYAYSNEYRNWYLRGSSNKTAHHVLKETLASLAVFGYGNKAVSKKEEYQAIFEGFQNILAVVLPKSLGFQKLLVEIPEVSVITKTGNFPLDSASGGLAAIIDIAWQLFTFSMENPHFVATLDEPENHLHPELQRQFIRNLISAFDSAQFIIATHNPFVITAVPDSNVYVLHYNENHKIISSLLSEVNKAASTNRILREVLGLKFTMPVWVEDRLNEIVEKFSMRTISAENLRDLRSELEDLGMGEIFPDAVERLIAESDGEDR